MKKSKLAVGILTSLMCVGALAACSEVKYSNKGYILTYKASDGSEKHYTADDLFKSYYTDADKTQTMFESIYKFIVKNEFASKDRKEDYESIKELAARDVEGDKQTAKKNADTNGTSYDKEFESILSGKGCKDEEELLQYYIYQRESEQFEDDFYDNNMDVLRGENVKESGKLNDSIEFDGYIKTMVPYHVSHILVKVDDSDSTKYWNGTIGEQDCYDLYDVVNTLAKGEKSFGSIAKTYSEDEGSGASYGDLGIMDKSTGYVDEFKLGLYAYENIYGTHAEEIAKLRDEENPTIAMSEEMKSDYIQYAKYDYSESSSIPTIPFEMLETYFNKDSDDCIAKITKGYDEKISVNEDNALFYPRNIYYNEYINRHAPSLISYEGGRDLPNFKTIFEGDSKKYLCAEHIFKDDQGNRISEYTPILVVRAGTGDYQGVHFITVNRNPFDVKDKNDCTLADYYTTYFPGQTGYPQREVKGVSEDQQTYVNFNNLDVKDSKDRADNLKSSIKGFDKNLQKQIYKVYKENGKIVFTEDSKEIGEAIDKWIEVSLEKTKFDNNENFDKSFNNYIDNLHQQKNEREKRLASVCAIGYQKYNGPQGEKTIDELLESGISKAEEKRIREAVQELKDRFESPKACGYTYTSWSEFTEKETINNLFDKVGGLCNDGKKH